MSLSDVTFKGGVGVFVPIHLLLISMLRFHPIRLRSFAPTKARRPVRRSIGVERRIMSSATDVAEVKRPDREGRFGRFGGQYVPETLVQNLSQLETEYHAARDDPSFQASVGGAVGFG